MTTTHIDTENKSTQNHIDAIEVYLKNNKEYNAFDILAPENVALCVHNSKVVHIAVNENAELIDYIVID